VDSRVRSDFIDCNLPVTVAAELNDNMPQF
jgi:hypothetical protein